MGTPLLATAANGDAPRTLTDLVNILISLLSYGTGLVITFGIVVYFWGIVWSMKKFGEGDADRFKSYFFWGILALFMMVSIWGILNILQQTVFNSNPNDPGQSSPGSLSS